MKLGLGDSYDKVFINKKLRAYADTTKPASTLGVMGVYLMASIFFYYYTGQPDAIATDFRDIIYVVVTVGLAHGASQAMNMAEDAEMDMETEHKQNRPIPAGIISQEEARTVAWVLILAAVGRAYLVNSTFGAVMSVLIFMGVFYNLDPIRAKERIISIPWQAASRGLLSFPAIWAAYGDLRSPTPWILGTFLFFYVLGFQNSADIIDRHVDEDHGIRTFIVEYGVVGTSYIALASTLLMVGVIGGSVQLGYLPVRLLATLLIIPFCLGMWFHMRYNPHRMSNATGNHVTWTWFYLGMVLSVAIPMSVEILH